MGGNRDSQLKKDALEQYATFLRKFVVGELTTHQSQPENEDCVKDSYVNDENDNSFPNPSFSCDDFNMALVKTRNVRSQDAWSILLLGKSFQYKAMELEHDDELKRDNAMRALQKVNAKPNLGSVLKDIQDSLPERNVSMLTAEDRDELFTKVDAAHAASLVTASSILSQLRRLKRN